MHFLYSISLLLDDEQICRLYSWCWFFLKLTNLFIRISNWIIIKKNKTTSHYDGQFFLVNSSLILSLWANCLEICNLQFVFFYLKNSYHFSTHGEANLSHSQLFHNSFQFTDFFFCTCTHFCYFQFSTAADIFYKMLDWRLKILARQIFHRRFLERNKSRMRW